MNDDQLIRDYLATNKVTVCRTRRAKGYYGLVKSFGGNRVFLASRTVASSEQAGMLRMGAGLRKYGN